MLSTWLYASSCTLDGADARDAVLAIMDVARPRNDALDVTGVLIWTGAHFAQFLEGPPAGIAALKQSISCDPRHHEIRTLDACEASSRVFDGWSLAYSGTSTFVEREIKRICALADTAPANGARDLKSLLVEFDQNGAAQRSRAPALSRSSAAPSRSR